MSQIKKSWLVTLIAGFINAIIAIIVSNFNATNKAIIIIALIFIEYAVYSELNKHFTNENLILLKNNTTVLFF